MLGVRVQRLQRGQGATPAPSDEWTFNLEFPSMGDFADAVDRAFALS